jgi:hypothetical protein
VKRKSCAKDNFHDSMEREKEKRRKIPTHLKTSEFSALIEDNLKNFHFSLHFKQLIHINYCTKKCKS